MDRKRFDELCDEAKAILEKAKAEGRDLTPQEISRKDVLFALITEGKAEMEAHRDAEREFERTEKAEFQRNSALNQFLKITNGATPMKSKAELEANAGQTVDVAAQREKYNHYLRTGETQQLRGGKEGEQFMITTGTDSGALIPVAVDLPDLVRRLYNSFLAAIVARGYKPIMTATGESIVIPIVDDTTVLGDTPAEDATGDSETDPSISNLALGANLFSSQSIWLSNTLISCIGFDLLGYLMPLLDKRVELKQDAIWVAKLLNVASGGNIFTTASATAFTYTELVKLFHTLNPVYRTDACWIVSDGFLQAVRLLVDSENRPLFNMLDPLINAGSIGTLFGCPVFISTNMPTVAANHVVAAFVSAECLKARFVTNRRIARYTNIPTYPDQVGFRLFENADAAVNPAGVAFMKTAAS